MAPAPRIKECAKYLLVRSNSVSQRRTTSEALLASYQQPNHATLRPIVDVDSRLGQDNFHSMKIAVINVPGQIEKVCRLSVAAQPRLEAQTHGVCLCIHLGHPKTYMATASMDQSQRSAS